MDKMNSNHDYGFGAYHRNATGFNSEDGHMQCFTNAGAPANAFRLGNECDSYTEIDLKSSSWVTLNNNSKKAIGTKLTLAINPANHTGYESSTVSLVNAWGYVDNLFNRDLKIWGGKRMNRDHSLGINDLFYFQGIEANGFGIENIKGFWGIAATNFYFVADDNADNGDGYVQDRIIELRTKDLDVLKNTTLLTWLATSQKPSAKDARTGSLVGIMLHTSWSNFSNKISISRGTGTLENLMKGAATAVDVTSVTDPTASSHSITDDANRIRVVEDLSYSNGNDLELDFATVLEQWDTGQDTDSKGQWVSVGSRLTYWTSDHFKIMFEAGQSTISAESEKDGNGSELGDRVLNRITIAPTIDASDLFDIHAEIRFFYTQSTWNNNNKGLVAPARALAGDTSATPTLVDTPFTDKTTGHNIGIQFEAWF